MRIATVWELRRRLALLCVAVVALAVITGTAGRAWAAETARADQLLPAAVTVHVSGHRGGQPGIPATVAGRIQVPSVTSLLDALKGVIPASALRWTSGSGITVALQFYSAAGWLTIATSTSDTAGRYKLRVPTLGYGVNRWRVRVAGSVTSAAVTTGEFRTTSDLDYRPAGSSKAYRLLRSDGTRWNPCVDIPLYLNSKGMPRGAETTVFQAVAKIREATGIGFVYAGRSTDIPYAKGFVRTRTGLPRQGLTIAWSTPETVGRLAGATVALAGTWNRTGWRLGRITREYVAAGIVVDRTAKLRVGWGRGRTLGYVLLHELGHVVGLDHVRARNQLMASTMSSSSVARFGAGDISGLSRLGIGRGCT